MNEYAYSFTIHGLSRIASGNKKEKIIWAIFISSAVATAAYLIQGYIKTYLKHEVYQDLTAMKIDTMYFPSVTFCLVSPKYILNNYYEPKCKIPKRKLEESSDFLTANSFFAVASCQMDRVSGCYQDDGLIHFREDMKHACFTWHPQRKFFQRERGMYIKFLVDDTVGRHDEVSVTIHDQDIDPMFLTPQLSISPEKRYLLKITKRITKRLPHPFPSKCSNKTKDHHFPGAYDRETCVAINRNIEIFKKHEEFSDLGKYSLQLAMGDKFNLSKYRDGFTRIALDRFLNDGIKYPPCPFSCYETRYEVTPSVLDNLRFDYRHLPSDKVMHNPFVYDTSYDYFWGDDCAFLRFNPSLSPVLYNVQIDYLNKDFYYLSEEKELYPWDKMLGEIGGIVGLMMGASALSIVEVLIYVAIASGRKML